MAKFTRLPRAAKYAPRHLFLKVSQLRAAYKAVVNDLTDPPPMRDWLNTASRAAGWGGWCRVVDESGEKCGIVLFQPLPPKPKRRMRLSS